MSIDLLHDFFVDQIDDIYSLECQMLKELERYAPATTDHSLQRAFLRQFEETREQKRRLELIMTGIALNPSGKDCRAFRSLTKDAQSRIANHRSGVFRDVVLTAMVQRMKHFEIAAYETAVSIGMLLGYSEAAPHLKRTLKEERAAASELTRLAVGGLFSAGLNQKARSEHAVFHQKYSTQTQEEYIR